MQQELCDALVQCGKAPAERFRIKLEEPPLVLSEEGDFCVLCCIELEPGAEMVCRNAARCLLCSECANTYLNECVSNSTYSCATIRCPICNERLPGHSIGLQAFSIVHVIIFQAAIGIQQLMQLCGCGMRRMQVQ